MYVKLENKQQWYGSGILKVTELASFAYIWYM